MRLLAAAGLFLLCVCAARADGICKKDGIPRGFVPVSEMNSAECDPPDLKMVDPNTLNAWEIVPVADGLVSCVPLSQPDIRDYLLCEHAGPSNNCPSRKDTWVIRSPSSCAVSPKRLPTPELQVMCSIYGTPYEWVTIAYTRNETCEEPASQKPRPGATRRRPKGLIPNAKVIRKLDGTANPLPVCNEENFRIPQGYAIVERFQGVNCNQLLPHTAGSISLPTQVIQLLLVYPPRSLGLYSVCTGTQLPHGYFRLPKSFHSDVCGGDPSELNTLQVKFIYTD